MINNISDHYYNLTKNLLNYLYLMNYNYTCIKNLLLIKTYFLLLKIIGIIIYYLPS